MPTPRTQRFVSSMHASKAARRPNILWIIADQHNADACGWANARGEVATPHLDRLASEGTVFDHAYCAQPLCVPSRASMMTGRMPHELGITVNMQPQPRRMPFPMIGRYMTSAGYVCGYVGKWHIPVPTDDVDAHGFTHLAAIAHGARGRHRDKDVVPACRAFLRQRGAEPFFLVASFTNPHDICQWARGEDLPNGPIGEPPPVDLRPIMPESYHRSPSEPAVLRRMMRLNPGMYPCADWSDDQWRAYRWAYFRLVEKVDEQIGKVLAALDEVKLSENTLVIYTSDHGEAAGGHRWTQKSSLYQECVRVPLTLRLPGQIERGRACAQLVCTGEDLLPTILDFAGVDVAERSQLPGCSIRQADAPQAGGESKVRRDVVVQTEFSGGFDQTHGVTGRCIVDGRYKYVVYSEDPADAQLFDLTLDPSETTNRAREPGTDAIAQRLRERLALWCDRRNDPFAACLRAPSGTCGN